MRAQARFQNKQARHRARGPSRAVLQKLMDLLAAGHVKQARLRLTPLLKKHKGSVALLNIAGMVQGQMGATRAAVHYFEEALKLAPHQPDILRNYAYLHYEARDFAKAAALYIRVLEIAPGHRVAQTNLGNCLLRMDLPDKALACFDLVLQAYPDDGPVHMLRARALVLLKDLPSAREAYDKAASLMPENGAALAHVDDLSRQMCDWSALQRVPIERLKACKDTPPPWNTLPIADDPEWQLRLSSAHAARIKLDRCPPPVKVHRSGPVRIGLFSSDFHAHATMDLLRGLIRDHDRARLEFVVFSYGATKDAAMHQWLCAQCSAVHDIAHLPDTEIVALAQSAQLDVAIDLKGYTADTRSELFAQRLAPAHVNYLGYPGTLGSGAFDYIIADDTIIPEGLAGSYAEQVLRMPGCYQPNDDQRVIAPLTTTRTEFGLSETALVLCCFNNPYKISPSEFGIWMRVMRRVPNAQLWLLPRNDWARGNLRIQAERRDVDPDRLVFADLRSGAEHLPRHRHADLFLDCFNVNAHTTASDALWAGLPVVTKLGQQFAARVSASLLKAVGLPDLVAETEDGYENIVMDLAANPAALAEVKQRLASALPTAPLFDTKRYAADFADLMERIAR